MQKIFHRDGFVWWIGVVEERRDPEKLGRVKIRIFGYHPEDKTVIPTDDLPWAIPIHPISSAASSGIGMTPVGPLPGTWAIGFFLDGEDMQQPAFFGTIGTKTAQLTFRQTEEKAVVANKNEGVLLDGFGNPVTDSEGNPVASGVANIPGWDLGQTSEKFETGGRGPGTINNYLSSEDRGGASYGSYQFASFLPPLTPSGKARPSSKNSPVLSYLKSSKYSALFAGLQPATPEFDAKWREIAQNDKEGFEKDQHDYTKRKYYDVMVANLQSRGLDLSSFGPAVQDLIWSTAVQFGPGRTDVFTVPLQGKPKLTDTDIVNIVSQYKIQNVETFFKSSGPAIISGVRNRYEAEKNDLLSLVA